MLWQRKTHSCSTHKQIAALYIEIWLQSLSSKACSYIFVTRLVAPGMPARAVLGSKKVVSVC